jgi:hypothetical protein
MDNKKKGLIIGAVVLLIAALIVRFAVASKNTLVGAWRMKGISAADGSAASRIDVIKEFKADGTETLTVGTGPESVVQNGTYTVAGDVLTEVLHSASNVRAGKADGPHTTHFTIAGNVLTLNISSGIAHTSEDYERVH